MIYEQKEMAKGSIARWIGKSACCVFSDLIPLFIVFIEEKWEASLQVSKTKVWFGQYLCARTWMLYSEGAF